MSKVNSEMLNRNDDRISVAGYYDENDKTSFKKSENIAELFDVQITKETDQFMDFAPVLTFDDLLEAENVSDNINQIKDIYQCVGIKEGDEEQNKKHITCTSQATSKYMSDHEVLSENTNTFSCINQCIEKQPLQNTVEEDSNLFIFEKDKGIDEKLLKLKSSSNYEDLNENENRSSPCITTAMEEDDSFTFQESNDEGEECLSTPMCEKLNVKNVNQSKKVNQYIKTKVLKEMIKNGASSDVFHKVIENFKIPSSIIKETLNVNVKEAQEFVVQESNSLSFTNMQAWLEYFEETKAFEYCSYELALIMNAIAHNELHPQPNDLGGVNLKSLYGFLSNALMGLPQPPLDNVSRAFLVREFENIINEANTENGDLNTYKMREELLENRETLPITSSLNPLNLHRILENLNVQF